MELMEIRRRLMMGMLKGAEVIKGSFTVPANGVNNYKIEFGKSFDKYIYIIEMTEESKLQLMQTGINANKGYARLGIYQPFSIDSISPSKTTHLSFRCNPSEGTVMATTATANGIDSSSIAIAMGAVTTNSTNILYNGYSYNYTIVSLD